MATHHRPSRIRWRKYVTRRIVVVTALSFIGYAFAHYLHLYFAAKGGEMCLGAVVGHLLVEVDG